ncbi:hypothetical protein HK102_002104, partial [Quaeritorhiza haematococci]
MAAGFDVTDDQLLYELDRIAEWSSTPEAFAADPYGSRISSGGSGQQQSSITDLAGLNDRARSLIAKLSSKVDQWVFSSSLPPQAAAEIESLHLSWLLALSPCRNFLAILLEDSLEIRARQSTFKVHAKVPLRRDPYPYWRRLSWSYDSAVLVVSGSDGGLQVIRPDGSLLCNIVNHTSTHSYPGTTQQSGNGGNEKEFCGVVSPWASLLIINPYRGQQQQQPFTYQGYPYTHELIAIRYDGLLRSYLINLDKFAEFGPPPLPPSLSTLSAPQTTPATLSRFSSAANLTIGSDSTNRPDLVVFYHRFSFVWRHGLVCSAFFDRQANSLVLGGLGPKDGGSGGGVGGGGAPFLDTVGVQTEGLLSEWQLISDSPFYRLRGGSNQNSNNTDPEETQTTGHWQALRILLSRLKTYAGRSTDIFGRLVHTIEASPNGETLLTVDCAGTLCLWRRGTFNLIRRYENEELVGKLEVGRVDGQAEVHNAAPPAMDGNSNPETKKTIKLISAGWWSDQCLFLGFSDGMVLFTRLPNLENIMDDAPEHFDGKPFIVCHANDSLLILDQKTTGTSQLNLGGDGILSSSRALTQNSQQTFFIRFINATAKALGWTLPNSNAPSSFEMSSLSLGASASSSQRTYIRLWRLQKITPLEALHTKLKQKEYGAALDIAKAFSLDFDEIYKSQWLASEINESSIRDYLGKIQDTAWVLRNCIDRVPTHPKVARALLQFGLKATNGVTMEDVNREMESVMEAIEEISAASSSSRAGSEQTTPTRGMSRVDVQGQKPVVDKIPPHVLCKHRLTLLKYLDRLETHVAIYGNSSTVVSGAGGKSVPFSRHFATFRDSNMIVQAVEYAVTGDVTALEVLFTRHGDEILPYRLSILDQLPETVDVGKCRHVLPRCEGVGEGGREVRWSFIPWRKRDWVEVPDVQEFVGWTMEESDTVELERKLQDLDIVRVGGKEGPAACDPVSAEVILEWYATRARRIERVTGQVDLAADLVRFGIENDVPGLQGLYDKLQTLSAVIYDCIDSFSEEEDEDGDEESEGVLLNLDEFEKLDDRGVLELLLSRTDPDSFVEDIERFVVPFLVQPSRKMVLQEGGGHDPRELLYQYLLEIAPAHLDWCVKVFEQSHTEAAKQEQRIIPDDVKLAELVLECAYRCEGTQDVGVLRRAFRCLPDLDNTTAVSQPSKSSARKQTTATSGWEDDLDMLDLDDSTNNLAASDSDSSATSTKETKPDTQSLQSLKHRMDLFGVHLVGMEILARYGLAKPLSWFARANKNRDLQSSLLSSLCRQSTGDDDVDRRDGERFENDDEWSGLLDNLLELRSIGVLGEVAVGKVYREFAAVLLGCFKLAKDILQPEMGFPPLPMDVCEKLVIDAAREYFDNAEDGSEASEYMRNARQCLTILPPTKPIQTELDLIDAVHYLSRHNITTGVSSNAPPILPIQVRLHSDRLSLVQQLLHQNKQAYASPDEV